MAARTRSKAHASSGATRKTSGKSTCKRAQSTTGASATKPISAAPRLLSGGNPQIPKADGDEPVQAYIAAMPGWKHDVGRRLDDLITSSLPSVKKAVRWNSPFYGVEEQGWFLSYHCFERYVKVTFHCGASLEPPPPVASKHPEVRYLHVLEDGELDEEQLIDWVLQSSRLPGERLF